MLLRDITALDSVYWISRRYFLNVQHYYKVIVNICNSHQTVIFLCQWQFGMCVFGFIIMVVEMNYHYI